FKPQVVVSVFPGVPHPNHGQHQVAGVTAYAAFPLAGDAAALPQLAAEGLVPWTPQALYRSTRFDPETPSLVLPLSGLDPRTPHAAPGGGGASTGWRPSRSSSSPWRAAACTARRIWE